MLKTLFLILLIYIAYRFIFGFVIPVSRATRTVRQQFKAAQDQMEAQMRAQQGSDTGFEQKPNSSSSSQDVSKSDYIDFEEIK